MDTQAPLSQALAHIDDNSPVFLTFLPMLYVAWADEVLSPTQMLLIEEKVKQQEWLLDEEKAQLSGWLDPSQPPSAKQLKRWLNAIRALAAEYPDASKHTLADLSMQIAKIGGGSDIQRFVSHQAKTAFEEVEAALGIVDEEILADMSTLPERPAFVPEPLLTGSFSPAVMTQLLDGDQAPIKRRIRVLLQDPVFKKSFIPQKEAYREKILEWCQLLAKQGLGALPYPKALGGREDMGAYISVFEMLAYHDLSLVIKFGVQFGLWGGSVANLGTAKHYDRYLKAIGTLELPGCFAMTEFGHGSNVRDIETTAVYQPDTEEFIIHTPHDFARKEYIGNAAAHGRMATVFAQLYTENECYGVHAFLVPIRDENGDPMPGVRIEDCGQKMGLNGVDNGRLWFDEVSIPRENLLDRFASVSREGTYSSPIPSESRRFFTMLSTLVGGRVSVPLAGLSAAKKGLAIAVKYANKRRQFGPEGEAETLILDYPSHQRRLLLPLAKAYALDFAHKYLLQRYLHQTEADIREVEALAAGLKAYTTWFTTQTLQTCREACGGNGYMSENELSDLKADTDIFTTFEGDNTVLMQLVAKGRLYEFKKRFGSMNFFGFVRYFGEKAATAITELNPIVTRIKDPDHLRSSDFQLAAFRYRESALVSSAARRIKHRLDREMDGYDAFLETQNHLITMAEAYIERVVLEQFVAVKESVKDPGVRNVLEKLCDLFALQVLETHKGWYLEAGYMESAKAKAIRTQVDALCAELRPEAEALVDAFAIPDTCLAAPIALDYRPPEQV